MGSCCVKRRRGVAGDESSTVLVGSVVRLDGGVVGCVGGDAAVWGRYDESGIGVEIVCRLW